MTTQALAAVAIPGDPAECKRAAVEMLAQMSASGRHQAGYIIGLLPYMDDDQLLTLHTCLGDVVDEAYRVRGAVGAEMVARALHIPEGREKLDLDYLGVSEVIGAVAVDLGVHPQTLRMDIKIDRVFESRALSPGLTRERPRYVYQLSVNAPDPYEALRLFDRKRKENGDYRREDFEKDVRVLKKPQQQMDLGGRAKAGRGRTITVEAKENSRASTTAPQATTPTHAAVQDESPLREFFGSSPSPDTSAGVKDGSQPSLPIAERIGERVSSDGFVPDSPPRFTSAPSRVALNVRISPDAKDALERICKATSRPDGDVLTEILLAYAEGRVILIEAETWRALAALTKRYNSKVNVMKVDESAYLAIRLVRHARELGLIE